MIAGVGIDVVDLARFERRLADTPGLAERLFTVAERELGGQSSGGQSSGGQSSGGQSLAARFAAKEALAKALGAPAGLRWTDVTVARGASGAPALEVSGTVAARAAELGIARFHVSLTHDAGIASAVVIAERDEATGPMRGAGR